MAKVQYLFTLLVFLLMQLFAASQADYKLEVLSVDKNPAFIQSLNLKTTFFTKDDCGSYLQQIIPTLQAKGYISASIDSVLSDSLTTKIYLFAGENYTWEHLSVSATTMQWLRQVGWSENQLTNQPLNYNSINILQQKMLTYFENNGYPFAHIYLDSLQLNQNKVSGRININPGPLYHVDSIKVTGSAKISSYYLQSFLGIENGSVYNKKKILDISRRLKQLTYIEETASPKFYWGSTGGIIELFLQQKKSNQVNFIIGLLPNNQQLESKKMMITGDALLHLQNALGSGETIGLNWQKLQVASQRLNILYKQPYLFKTPFGLDFGFDMFKKDSTFLNFTFKLGAQYTFTNKQYIKVFLQQFSTIVSNINTATVLQTRQLPNEADVKLTDIGFEYGINTTNYIYNPVNGFELLFISQAGNKRIKRNNQILELKDPNEPEFDFATLYDTVKTSSYQFRSTLLAAKYFPLGSKLRSTVKAALNGGYIGGSNIFRNELFQIGGYRLLRGFDEQSQYLSQYGILTAEYRYLVGENSYFNVFSDGGWGRNASRGSNNTYTYISAGLGMAFETKIGLFNLAWALGKRNDTEFNLRQSKIHFGFLNYF
ncbi:MAG: POTRA domain-containing protein [Niabella sp.]